MYDLQSILEKNIQVRYNRQVCVCQEVNMKYIVFLLFSVFLTSCAEVEISGNYCDAEKSCSGNLICVDNKCVENNQPCSPTNLTGVCSDGKTCVNGICVTNSACTPNPCSESHKTRCVNNNGTAVCSCDVNYVDDGNGNCIIQSGNPCLPNPCTQLNKSICSNNNGSAVCSCNTGYTEDNNGNCINPVDPCNPNPCTQSHKTLCFPENNSYICDCEAGYIDDGNGNCIDQTEDPCTPNPCTESHKTICENNNGNAVCLCESGYIEDINNNCIIQTVNPCDPNPCTQSHKTVCANNNGAAVCSCETNYYDDGNGNCIAGCTIDTQCQLYQSCNTAANTCNDIMNGCDLFTQNCSGNYSCYTFNSISTTGCSKTGVLNLNSNCNNENECKKGLICTQNSLGVKKCLEPCKPSQGAINNPSCDAYNRCTTKAGFSDVGYCSFDQSLVPIGAVCETASNCPANAICTGFMNSADVDICISECTTEGELNSSLFPNWVVCTSLGSEFYWLAVCNSTSECNNENLVCVDTDTGTETNTHYCFAKPIGYDCSKVNKTFCGAGKGCYQWDNTHTSCQTAGTVPKGGNCSSARCVAGNECWFVNDVATCLELCDANNACSSGTCSYTLPGEVYGYCN